MSRASLPVFDYGADEARDLSEEILESRWAVGAMTCLLQGLITPERFLLQLEAACQDVRERREADLKKDHESICFTGGAL
jgi:hypothetical protein